MSNLSGKCDLYDHICMERTKCADEDCIDNLIKCFEIFKERTGGFIHQHKVLKVTPWNQSFIEEVCPLFKVIEHKEKIKDKRFKDGFKEVIHYTYNYLNKEYTLNQINKSGVMVESKIKFETLVDLLPYLPYVISLACCDDKGEHIVISERSYIEEKNDSELQFGHPSDCSYGYRKEMSDLYRDVILKCFNPQGREIIEELEFDDNGLSKTSFPIDYNFDVKWEWEDNDAHIHWTRPVVKDFNKGIISMNKQDLDYFIGHKVMVFYVKQKDD